MRNSVIIIAAYEEAGQSMGMHTQTLSILIPYIVL